MENQFFKKTLSILNSILFGAVSGFHFPKLLKSYVGLDIDLIFIKIFAVLILTLAAYLFLSKISVNKEGNINLSKKNDVELPFEEKQFSRTKLLNIVANSDLSVQSQKEFIDRLKTLETLGKDDFFIHLKEQYDLSIESERFYEKTIWQIASIFIPVSLTLTSLGFSDKISPIQLSGGFIIYLFFLILFQRFRHSIRLNRDYSIFLEKILGLFSQSFVYEYSSTKYGTVLKVWTILVNFGLFYFTFLLYHIFN